MTRVCHASLRSSGEGGVSHRMCLASDSGRNCVACVSSPQSLAATRPLVCASEVHTRQQLSRVCMGPAAAGSTRYRAKRFDVVVAQVDESAADPLVEPGEDAASAQKQDKLGEDQGAGCAAAPTRLAEPARTHGAEAHTEEEQYTPEASGDVVAEAMAAEDEQEVSGAGHASIRTRAPSLPCPLSHTFTQCLHEIVHMCIHCARACTHAHAHTHTGVDTYVHKYKQTYTYIYTCTCVHPQTGRGWLVKTRWPPAPGRQLLRMRVCTSETRMRVCTSETRVGLWTHTCAPQKLVRASGPDARPRWRRRLMWRLMAESRLVWTSAVQTGGRVIGARRIRWRRCARKQVTRRWDQAQVAWGGGTRVWWRVR